MNPANDVMTSYSTASDPILQMKNWGPRSHNWNSSSAVSSGPHHLPPPPLQKYPCLLHSSYAGESLKTSGQKRVKCSLWEKLDEAGRVRTRRRGVAPAGRGGDVMLQKLLTVKRSPSGRAGDVRVQSQKSGLTRTSSLRHSERQEATETSVCWRERSASEQRIQTVPDLCECKVFWKPRCSQWATV